MITKCLCNNCSTHLEFDTANEGETIACPSCGMDTKLYIPQAAPMPQASPGPRSNQPIPNPYIVGATVTTSEALNQVRAETCYRTLRDLINTAFLLAKLGVGFIGLLGVLGGFGSWYAGRIELSHTIVAAIVFLVVALIIITLLHAAHQGAVLLIDLTDCAIYQVAEGKRKPANVAKGF